MVAELAATRMFDGHGMKTDEPANAGPISGRVRERPPVEASAMADIRAAEDRLMARIGAGDRDAARELMATLRESPPCLTETADVSGLACVVLWQFYRRSKQETYRRLGMTRWTSWRPLERKEPPSHNGSRAPKPAP